MIVVIHHQDTGRIARTVTCQPEDVALQPVPDGHAALVLEPDHPPIDDRHHRVQSGSVVDGPRVGSKAEALAASRIPKPSTPSRI
jgi:hypothetical protein